MLSFKRFLSLRTTVNPAKNFKLLLAPRHDSLLLVSTPSQLNQAVENLFNLSKTIKGKNLTAVVACVDSVYGSRNAVSEAWFQKPIEIGDYSVLPDDADKNEGVRSSMTSAAPIKLDSNWKDTSKDTLLEVEFGAHKVGLTLANTLFANCEPSTCFFVRPGDHPDNWNNLQRLEVMLGEELNSPFNIKRHCKLRELELEQNQPKDKLYQITQYTSNMIESINDKPASEYLINNTEIQKSKKDLFLQLIDQTHPETASAFQKGQYTDSLYQLIVGGLGWGTKQGTIVVDPEVGEVGHRYVRLFQHDPTIQYELSKEGQTQLVAECSDLQDGYPDVSAEGAEKVIEGAFGLGCEKGFRFDGIWHKSHGEVLELTTASK